MVFALLMVAAACETALIAAGLTSDGTGDHEVGAS